MEKYIIVTKNNGGDYMVYVVESEEKPSWDEAIEWLKENSSSASYWKEDGPILESPQVIQKVEVDGKI